MNKSKKEVTWKTLDMTKGEQIARYMDMRWCQMSDEIGRVRKFAFIGWELSNKVKKMLELSNCCNAPVYESTWDEGKFCWICIKCQERCDIGGKSFKEEDV